MALRRRPAAPVARQPKREVVSKRDFFSYHASRQTTDTATTSRASSPVRPEVARKFLASRPLTAAVVILVLVCVGYSTVLSTQPRIIVNVPATQKMLRPIGTYQMGANSLFDDTIFNKNKLTINTNKLQAQLQQEFPELNDVTVSLPLLGQRPIVRAVAEQPALLLASQKGVFVIGTSGKAFVKTADLSSAGDLALPTVADEANLTVQIGKGALSQQDVTFITTIVKQFDAKNSTVASITLPPLASELHVRLADKPYYIKFSLMTDPRIAAGQYFALIKKLDADNITPGEYIDSRVEERIFYR